MFSGFYPFFFKKSSFFHFNITFHNLVEMILDVDWWYDVIVMKAIRFHN